MFGARRWVCLGEICKTGENVNVNEIEIENKQSKRAGDNG